jgi:hypothetical protein
MNQSAELHALPAGVGASADETACTALVRWSGCTANAPEFSEMLGDGVSGRRAMLSMASAASAAEFAAEVGPLAEIHCEVSGEIARLLGMPRRFELELRQIFRGYDATAQRQGPRDVQASHEVLLVSIAGDLEITFPCARPR